VVTTDGETLRSVAFGDRNLSDAPIAIEGDPRLGKALFRLFVRPSAVK
jgi:hypothetical protein